jgi:internalin A
LLFGCKSSRKITEYTIASDETRLIAEDTKYSSEGKNNTITNKNIYSEFNAFLEMVAIRENLHHSIRITDSYIEAWDTSLGYWDDKFRKTLSLDSNIIDISSVGDLKNIKNLFIDRSSISDISFIANLDDLEWLSIRSGQNIIDISPITKLKNLHHLELVNITDISPISDLKSLEHLQLYSDYFFDISPIGELESLKYLTLKNLYFDMSYDFIIDLSPISNLRNLEILDMGIRINRIENFNPIFDLISLKMLIIYNLEEKDIINIGRLQNLEYLTISILGQGVLKSLAALTQLKVLGIICDDDVDVSPLLELPNLEKIVFGKWIDITPLAVSNSIKEIGLYSESPEKYYDFINTRGNIFVENGIKVYPSADWR